MHRQRAGGGDPWQRPAPLSTRETQEEPARLYRDTTTGKPVGNALASLRAFVLSFAGLAGFLLSIALAGYVAAHLGGLGVSCTQALSLSVRP